MDSKKRIAIVGTVGVPAAYGGFETLAEHLVRNLSKEYDLTVYCSGKKYKKEERKSFYYNARLKYLPLDANGIQSIFYDTLSIIHAIFHSHIILVLGVSGAWILPFVRKFTNKKIIVSIDGIEWKRAKWNFLARIYLFWAEKLAVKHSHIDISDNESIQNYTAMRYGSLSRIIEYGSDHTAQIRPTNDDRKEFRFLSRPYVFKVCRIEPENNIHEVLQAFSEMPDYNLVIVGNWNNSEYGFNLKNTFATCPNVILLDPIYEQRKLDVLRSNALIYIHGHSAGGTNPSLIEAMNLGLPVVAFDVAYNRTTTENRAVYFNNHNDLKEKVEMISVKQLEAIGDSMKSIAQRRYSWSLIARKYSSLMAEVLSVKEKVQVKPRSSKVELPLLLDMGLGHLKYQQSFYENR